MSNLHYLPTNEPATEENGAAQSSRTYYKMPDDVADRIVDLKLSATA